MITNGNNCSPQFLFIRVLIYLVKLSFYHIYFVNEIVYTYVVSRFNLSNMLNLLFETFKNLLGTLVVGPCDPFQLLISN